jgi:hypothetical protein
MFQKILGDWNDLIILIIIIYLTLVYFGKIKYPNDRWQVRMEKMKNSDYDLLYKCALFMLIALFLGKVIMTVYN